MGKKKKKKRIEKVPDSLETKICVTRVVPNSGGVTKSSQKEGSVKSHQGLN